MVRASPQRWRRAQVRLVCLTNAASLLGTHGEEWLELRQLCPHPAAESGSEAQSTPNPLFGMNATCRASLHQ